MGIHAIQMPQRIVKRISRLLLALSLIASCGIALPRTATATGAASSLYSSAGSPYTEGKAPSDLLLDQMAKKEKDQRQLGGSLYSTVSPPKKHYAWWRLVLALLPLTIIVSICVALAVWVFKGLRGRVHWPDTRGKRIALVAFPFFFVPDLMVLDHDLSYYGYLSIPWALLLMASILCLLLAFTRLASWINRE